MKYLQIDLTNNNVKDKAKQFSRLLWKLNRPHYVSEDTTLYLFRRIKHPSLELGALVFNETMIVKFNLYKDNGDFRPRSVEIIEELIDLLYPKPQTSDAKREQIRNYVKNNEGATVEQILPNTLPNGMKMLTEQEAQANGWFEEVI